MNIIELMTSLAQTRPVFHSEADFQFAFAWKIQEQYPNAEIRLEYPIRGNRLCELDIFVSIGNRKYGIELKYKTRRSEFHIGNEYFNLTNQGALLRSRYFFLNDIRRLENFKNNGDLDAGFAIFLTNERNYWLDPEQEVNATDMDFRIHEGRAIHCQELEWAENVGDWVENNEMNNIEILGEYTFNWHHYSEIENKPNGSFKFTFVKINNG